MTACAMKSLALAIAAFGVAAASQAPIPESHDTSQLLDRVRWSRGDEFYEALQTVTGDWPSTVDSIAALLRVAAERHDEVVEPGSTRAGSDSFRSVSYRSGAIFVRLGNAIREGPIGPQREGIARDFVQHLERAMYDERYSETERTSMTEAIVETVFYPNYGGIRIDFAPVMIVPAANEELVVTALIRAFESRLPVRVRISALSRLVFMALEYGERPFGTDRDAVKGLLLEYIERIENDIQQQVQEGDSKYLLLSVAQSHRLHLTQYGLGLSFWPSMSISEADFRALMEASLYELAQIYESEREPHNRIAYREMLYSEHKAESRKYLLSLAEDPRWFSDIFSAYAHPVPQWESLEEKSHLDYLLGLFERHLADGRVSLIRENRLIHILYSLQSVVHYRKTNTGDAQEMSMLELHGRQRVWSLLLRLLEYPDVREREMAASVLPAVMAEYPETVETFLPVMEGALQAAQEEREAMPRRYELKGFMDALTDALDCAVMIRSIRDGKGTPDAKVAVTNIFAEDIVLDSDQQIVGHIPTESP